MTPRARPEVVVFDVVETLASLDVVRDRLTEIGQPAVVLPAWFTRLLRDGMAVTAAGSFAGFAEVAASALRAETRHQVSDARIRFVIEGFGAVGPQPDAVPAVRAAAHAGLRVFTLSNGAAATTAAFLDRIGVADLIEQVLSIDEVAAWKPASAPYRLAVERAGRPAERVALVAVHSWDIHGAHQAGMTTGWCPRLEGVRPDVFVAADVVADTLDGVVRGLADLPVDVEG